MYKQLISVFQARHWWRSLKDDTNKDIKINVEVIGKNGASK